MHRPPDGVPLSSTSVIVGRERERDLLRGALEAARGGRGSLALLGGEAGIGKTTLVEDLAARAGAVGCAILRGGCYDLTTTPPYGPWAEASRATQALADAPPLPLGLQPGGAAQLDSQAELFKQLGDFVLALAGERPLLLVLEDLHWADSASLELLRVLARRLADAPVLLAVTYRSDELTRRHPLYQLLPLLARESQALRLDLRRLDDDAIGALVAARYALRESDREGLCAYLSAHAEGNPFYIGELLRTLEAERLLTGNALGDLTSASVPPLVRQMLDGRLARLDDATRGLLEVAAVIGQRVPLDLWRAVADVDEAVFDTAAAQALEQRWLLSAPGHIGELRFSHALVHEALHEGVLLTRRQAWHRRAGELVADAAHSDPDTVAHHFQQAADPRAATWLLRAGQRAQTVWDLPGAVTRLTAALALPGALTSAEQLRARQARGRAYETIGDFPAARADLEAARDLATSSGERRLVVEVLHDLGLLWSSRDWERAGNCYREALDTARALDEPITLAHALNRLANWEMNHDEPADAWRHQSEALAAFRALDNRRGIAQTLDYMGITALVRLDYPAAASSWAEALELFTSLGDRRALSSVLVGYALRNDATPDGLFVPLVPLAVGLADAQEALRIAREIAWGAGEVYALQVVAICQRALGDYGATLEAADRSMALALDIGHHYWRAGALAVRAQTLHDIGRLDEAVAVLESGFALARDVGSRNYERLFAAILAHMHVDAGDVASAERLLDDVFGPDFALDSTWPFLAEMARVEAARLRGDARETLARVERFIAAIPRARLERAPVWPALRRAEALAALGRADEAEAALRAAVRDARDHGARPWLWRVQVALGRLYAAQGRRAAARAELDAARALVDELAATLPDGELRARYLEHALATFPTEREAARPHGLTARELEVLRLLADGCSDREIATALVISHRTATSHITHIFNKLGVNSRTAAATLALRQGLI